MAVVGIKKIAAAIRNGVPLRAILTPEQYNGYLLLEEMRAQAAAKHRPSDPLPAILRLLPPPRKKQPATKKTENKNKNKKTSAAPDDLPPDQPLPRECLEVLAGKGVALDDGSVNLIFVKRLFSTDVSAHHRRLTMPFRQVRGELLRAEEEEVLRGKNEKKKPKKMAVRVIEPSLEEQSMLLAKWNNRDGKSWWYALTNDWEKVVRRNRLVEGDVIQVWSFRVQGELGLLIHKTESAPTDQADGDDDDGDDDDGFVGSDGSGSSGDHGYVEMRWGSHRRRGSVGSKRRRV